MPALILRFHDGRKKAVDCPPASDPEQIAIDHGAELEEFCDSMSDAQFRIGSDPNGKADSI